MLTALNEWSLPFTIPTGGIYGTRSSEWAGKIGNAMDPLNMRFLWPRTGKYGIPCLEPTDFTPTMLAAWHDPHGRQDAADTGGAVHFFLDDYRFEPVWKNPEKYLPRVQDVGAALTPDFSIWRDMPYAIQIWQTYRARWLGAFWQHHGIKVIPTVSWGEPDTYDFCFEGLPQQGTLAISTVGVTDPTARELFQAGATELIARTEPTQLVCYGPAPEYLNVVAVVREYPTFWQQRRKPQDGR
jgi:hypothetical protein